MSLKASNLVWRQSRQSGSALVVLLALADFADDTMRAWPSVSTLAERARIGRRAAHKLLAKLIQDGEVIQDGHTRRGVVVYRIMLRDGASADGQPVSAGSQVSNAGVNDRAHLLPSDVNPGSGERQITHEAEGMPPVNRGSGDDLNASSQNPLSNLQDPSQRAGAQGPAAQPAPGPSWGRVKATFPAHQQLAWLDGLKFAGIDAEGFAHLAAPSKFVAERVEQQMGDDICRAFASEGWKLRGIRVSAGTVVNVEIARQGEGGAVAGNGQRRSA